VWHLLCEMLKLFLSRPLGKIGLAAKTAVPGLTKALGDKNIHVRVSAACAFMGRAVFLPVLKNGWQSLDSGDETTLPHRMLPS
jgi:hypothetical protein